jgi:hypothetical protein
MNLALIGGGKNRRHVPHCKQSRGSGCDCRPGQPSRARLFRGSHIDSFPSEMSPLMPVLACDCEAARNARMPDHRARRFVAKAAQNLQPVWHLATPEPDRRDATLIASLPEAS